MNRRQDRRLAPWSAAAAVLAAALAGCAGPVTSSEGELAVGDPAFDTYAWVDTAASEADERARAALDARLSGMGLHLVTRPDASLLVRLRTEAEVKLKSTDPYYSYYSAEKYEEGMLEVDMVDASTGERVWRGISRARLRPIARGVGLSRVQFVELSEERVWPIEAMVGEILGQSGLREALAARPADRISRKSKRALYRRIYESVPEPAPTAPAEKAGAPG